MTLICGDQQRFPLPIFSVFESYEGGNHADPFDSSTLHPCASNRCRISERADAHDPDCASQWHTV